VNPETAADRRMFVQDFGETCTITPTAGGTPFTISAIFNAGPQRTSELELDQIGSTNVVGSNPHLELSSEERAKIAELDEVAIPSKAPITYRISTIEPEDVDGGFFVAELLEV
jgi:hypothetical protein